MVSFFAFPVSAIKTDLAIKGGKGDKNVIANFSSVGATLLQILVW